MPKTIYIKNCKYCQTEFETIDNRIKFCSQSCSGKYGNKKRKRIKYTYWTLFNLFRKVTTFKLDIDILGKYSIVYPCICNHCQTPFYSKTKMKYCSKHKNLYSDNSRAKYRFKFDIFQFADLFPPEKINEKGLYTRKNINGKIIVTNIDGWILDHRVTINDAIHNNYDPFYIKHPINCQLLTHKDNMIKGIKSSINYEQLIKEVDEYEKNKALIR